MAAAQTPEPAPEQVARGFGRGEPEATEAVRLRVRKILAFRGWGIPPDDRRDLEQEVMTQLWQAAERPGSELGAGFWGLVEVVASRRSIDWLRRSRPHQELDPELADNAGGPLDRALAEERARLGARVLEGLSEPCRELIRLHALEGRSYREMAAELGKSEGALRVQMHRCVERARAALAELTTDSPGTRVEG